MFKREISVSTQTKNRGTTYLKKRIDIKENRDTCKVCFAYLRLLPKRYHLETFLSSDGRF